MQFEMDSAREVLQEFQRIVKFYDQKKYVKAAFEIATKYHITIYDSLVIATALGENCDLVTSDEKQGRISSENGILTIIV